MARTGPIAIVAEELKAENVPLRYAWIGKLREERDISRAIGIINKILPPISHLKRCSAKTLVLAFLPSSSANHDPVAANSSSSPLKMSGITREKLTNLLSKAELHLTNFENEKIYMKKVPALQPKTKLQAEMASKIWPVNFHPDPHLERILDGTCFNVKQLRIIQDCSRLCIEVALRGNASGTKECHGSAVIYDPTSDKIVALAASKIALHPMWHASMVAIDLVAKLASGGAYELTGENQQTYPLAFPSELVEIARRFNYDDKPPIYTYLCTNFWVFLLREPCSMCAMALLHSRISRIFYNIANECRGVLGSRALLHEIPGLNHRYGVWKSSCENESRRAFDEILEAERVNQ